MSDTDDIRDQARSKMQKSLEALRLDLSKIRTGRVHVGILDGVMVRSYGNFVPINQVASLSVLDSRTICVKVWDKSLVSEVEKAIRDSDLGLNPVGQGDILRVVVPALSSERRKELVKLVRSEVEGAKVSVRNIRRHFLSEAKSLLKGGSISEDEERRFGDQLQRITDSFVSEIDSIFAEKEKELLEI